MDFRMLSVKEAHADVFSPEQQALGQRGVAAAQQGCRDPQWAERRRRAAEL